MLDIWSSKVIFFILFVAIKSVSFHQFLGLVLISYVIILYIFVGIIGETSMFMDVSLSNVNVGMPLSVHDKCSVEGRSLYLLRPFDVKVVSNINMYCTVVVSISISHWTNWGHTNV